MAQTVNEMIEWADQVRADKFARMVTDTTAQTEKFALVDEVKALRARVEKLEQIIQTLPRTNPQRLKAGV